MESDRKDIYFANLPTDEIGDAILKRVEGYYDHLVTSGKMELYRRSYQQYYNALRTGGKVGRIGEQGEYSSISVNDFRNLLLHLQVLTSSERLSFEPQATNTDKKTQAQTILASGLLDYYMRTKRLEKKLRGNLETCLWCAEAFTMLSWDVHDGEEYGVDPDTQQIIRKGDIQVSCYNPTEMVTDFTLKTNDKVSWRIAIDFENRYELAARYPELADLILSVSQDYVREKYSLRVGVSMFEESDLIPVYRFRHEKTMAVPQGRLVELVDSDIILVDNPLPYKRTHIYRLAPAEQEGSIHGYTVAYDLLPVQEAQDGMYSTILTNNSTFGVQNIAVPMGHNLNLIEVVEGLNLLEYDPKLGKPEVLQLTGTAPETYNFLQILKTDQETLSGVNKTARGTMETKDMSGSALALVQSMAIQFSSGLQIAYMEHGEDVGTGIIEILQEFASSPRVSEIAGKSNKTLMKEWSSKDISSITRVMVSIGNALTKTVAGRVNLADKFLDKGMARTPEEYIQVLNTGKLDPMTEGIEAELLLVREENEGLLEGKPVKAIWTDDHVLHLQEHKVVLASIEARTNPDLLNRTLAHITEHLTEMRQQDPLWAQINRQPLPPPPAQLPPPPGGPGVDPSLNPTPGPVQDAGNVPLPNQPTNPISGQPFNPQTGGLPQLG
jgi:hypothetical protein